MSKASRPFFVHRSRHALGAREPKSDSNRAYLRRRFGQYLHHRELMTGTIILVVYVFIGIAAWFYYRGGLSFIASDPSILVWHNPPSPPTISFFPPSLGVHSLGETGLYGFSVTEALVKATPWDLMLFTGILIPTCLLGLVLGVIAGGSGGFIDDALMTLTDIVLSVPPFVVALMVFVVVLPGLTGMEIPLVFIAAMILINWAPYARVVRAEARRVAAKPFVEASRASGASKARLLFRHVLPNSFSPMLSQIPITLSNLIVILTIIPYVGIVTSGQYLHIISFMPNNSFPEWTWILVNGMVGWDPNIVTNPWWGYVFPFLWIFVFGFGVVMFCDGLEDYLSPASGSRTH
jgi:peptide/nickel transport system permease protein